MKPGEAVTAKDIDAMLQAQGLQNRGLLPGDVLYIYTGWGDNWKDPDTEKFYYTKGPGLAYDAAKYIEEKQIVLIALDNPFTDPVADGFLQGKAGPPAGTPPNTPFAIHHHDLTQAGIYQIQNANLGALANDKVWVSCTMILPLRAPGNSGSPVRPVAIGAPAQESAARDRGKPWERSSAPLPFLWRDLPGEQHLIVARATTAGIVVA